MKDKRYKKFIFIGMILILFIFLIVKVYSAAHQTGKRVKLDDYEIRVDKVVKSQGTDYTKPKNGKEFAVVTVTLTNNGKKSVKYNPLDFVLRTEKGDDINANLNVDGIDILEAGTLKKGEKVTGNLVGEVKKGTRLQLVYKTNTEQEVDIDLQ